MKTFRKMIVTTLCASCAVCAGVATAEWNDINVASAAVATEYTTVETAMMMKLENVSIDNGNFNIYATTPTPKPERRSCSGMCVPGKCESCLAAPLKWVPALMYKSS